MAKRFGMTDFVNPNEVKGDLLGHLVELTGGGDYTFDATGNVGVMRTALEASHKGWGESVIIGVAPAGAEIATRPFQLVTGRTWEGTAFGGARGRTDVPKIVDWYMDGKIEIDPMITHILKLEEINKGFEMMHAGESIRSCRVALNCEMRNPPNQRLCFALKHEILPLILIFLPLNLRQGSTKDSAEKRGNSTRRRWHLAFKGKIRCSTRHISDLWATRQI